MSHDAPVSGAARERLAARRQGLRIAAAVAVGFTAAIWAKAAIPFLIPVFAAQFLTASRRPPSLTQGLAMIVLVLVLSQVLALAVSVFTGHPLVLGAVLWLLYFVCFYFQAEGKGGAATFVVLVIAIIVPLLEIEQIDLGESITAVLTKAAMSGVVLA